MTLECGAGNSAPPRSDDDERHSGRAKANALRAAACTGCDRHWRLSVSCDRSTIVFSCKHRRTPRAAHRQPDITRQDLQPKRLVRGRTAGPPQPNGDGSATSTPERRTRRHGRPHLAVLATPCSSWAPGALATVEPQTLLPCRRSGPAAGCSPPTGSGAGARRATRPASAGRGALRADPDVAAGSQTVDLVWSRRCASEQPTLAATQELPVPVSLDRFRRQSPRERISALGAYRKTRSMTVCSSSVPSRTLTSRVSDQTVPGFTGFLN